jgi:succinate dehydrogenase hydrophobic anchor subunit
LQDGTYWTIYYLLFIPAVVYHACNGVWGVVLDYNPPLASRKPLLLLFWVSGLGLTIYGYFGIQPLLGGG